jgi:predicted anti-sigma-YlaC factor YlaD
MTCTDVRERLAAFLALEMEAHDEASLREHLTACPACREAVTEREPSFCLVWSLAGTAGLEDDAFAGEVLAGVHQRRMQGRLALRRPRLLAAAAVLVAVLGGALVVRLGGWWAPQAAPALEQAAAHASPGRPLGFVDVEGAGVRVYNVAAATGSSVGVAVIVKPGLEL